MTGIDTPMKQWIPLLLALLAGLIYACTPTPETYTELENRVVDVVDAQSVLIQVDHGELTILQSQDSRIRINGQALYTNELEYVIDPTEEQILIKVFTHRDSSSKVPLDLMIQLPEQMEVKVETENASVLTQDFQGDLEVSSTAGDITAERIQGSLTLRSNRGNIMVRESSGDISVVGNYGALTVQNVSGETAVSTIMGNILFGSLIKGDDTVRLETDHGSVSVNVSADSALTLQVRSTSGDVTCMLPDMIFSTRTCDGMMHSGEGSLSIRTVSGAVTLQLIP
jgi:DUF4097 and DUF4098 domain-containing protein YvlB